LGKWLKESQYQETNSNILKSLSDLNNDQFCHSNQQINKNNEKLEVNTPSVSITLEKVSSNNITDKHLLQSNGAKIRFPPLNLNKSIIINVTKMIFSSKNILFI
jgi:hypothetical protein